MPVIQRQSVDPATESVYSLNWHLDAANQNASNSHIL